MQRARDIKAYVQARIAATDKDISTLRVVKDDLLQLLDFIESNQYPKNPRKVKKSEALPTDSVS